MAGMLQGECTEEKSQRPGDCQGSFPLSADEKLHGWGCSNKSDGDRKSLP